MSRNILVTGAAGFIGANFAEYFVNKHPEYNVIVLDKLTYAGNMDNLKKVMDKITFVKGDICDFDFVLDLFKKYDINGVIHFAAESHVDNSIKNPFIFTHTNVIGTHTLLEAAKRTWGEGSENKFVHISTDEVYGSLKEDGYFTETSPIKPSSPYSASKASSDLIAFAYHETFKMNVNVTNCSNNYGPFQFPEKLIPLLINNCLAHKDLPVYGDGMNIRDWLFVEDHAKAIDMVINNGRVGEVYNVGGHNERTNIQIVKTVIEYLNENVDKEITETLIKYVEDRKGHDRRYGIDPTKIKEELGWYPETTFEVGIKKTIQWYLDNQEWMKNITSGEYMNYYNEMYK